MSIYLPLEQIMAANYAGVFGDGSDGSVTFDGTTTILGFVPAASSYTMTRDIFCTSITINNGVTVKPNGFRIFVTATGTLTNNGTISCTGGNASGTNGSTAGGASNTSTCSLPGPPGLPG